MLTKCLAISQLDNSKPAKIRPHIFQKLVYLGEDLHILPLLMKLEVAACKSSWISAQEKFEAV